LICLHQAELLLRRYSEAMKIQFPGGLRVDAFYEGFWIRTDQPVAQGGAGTAPSPFDLFLASIGTCAGFYALRFCQQRNLDTDGLTLSVGPERDAAGKHVDRIRIEITLPAAFPLKYREALLRAVDQCAVKRHLVEPPKFEVALAGGQRSALDPARFSRVPAALDSITAP
jgi:ribosomal protein S12 methylthiotransferase accessory factor